MVTSGSMSKDDCSPSSANGIPSMERCQSVESLAEWRSSDQVENGTPSTKPPHWDSDDDGDSGPKPSDLFVKFTWKIENFSQISKRELRSNVFEASGYRWYILVYPHGCDACHHLSLFLCVHDHDKLLPGWGHYALFTIAVLNKDPKKNKYNDTLHRFWKKEHDWGWKKFLEQTKVNDGFIDDGVLTIKAQVQVIRLKANRPFRCLDFQYRRELIRVYLSNVEQTCAKFVDERRQQLQKMIGNNELWSSIQTFWLGIDKDTRCRMSRDKKDSVLKVVVKQFFIEKEFSSTLVMDSLHSGLRALESQSKRRKLKANKSEKELSAPYIYIENDMFILADDVFQLLERAALELPRLSLPSKEEKGLTNRTKDGTSGDEFNRDSILRDEKRLTELGRWTLEIFILAHIFSSRVDLAYKEMIALKRQEELIREEEAAEQAENEKRDKRARKKQAKQRRNNRKNKDGENDETIQLQDSPDEGSLDDVSLQNEQQVDIEKIDVSDPIAEACSSSSSELPNGHVDRKSSSFVDDSSSTCSTDSVPSVVNGPYKNKRSSSKRGKKQQNKDTRNYSNSVATRLVAASGISGATVSEFECRLDYLNDQNLRLKEPIAKKGEAIITPGNKTSITDQIEEEIPSISRTSELSSSSIGPIQKPLQNYAFSIKNDQVPVLIKSGKSASLSTKSRHILPISKPDAPKNSIQHPSISRPSSAPVSSAPKHIVPDSSASQSGPKLLRTLSSVAGSEPQNFEPQSYRNAIMGIKSVPAPQHSTSSFSAHSITFSQQMPSYPLYSGFPFGSIQQESSQNVRIGNSQESIAHVDDFPHLDIINDLLDDEGSYHYQYNDNSQPFNWQHTFPRELDHVNGYYQFELPEYYNDEISEMVYDSFAPFNDYVEVKPEPLNYINGMDALLHQNQWPIDNYGATVDVNGYAYGVGGYNMMYQPSNGI